MAISILILRQMAMRDNTLYMPHLLHNVDTIIELLMMLRQLAVGSLMVELDVITNTWLLLRG